MVVAVYKLTRFRSDKRMSSEDKNQTDITIEKVGHKAVIKADTFELEIESAEKFEKLYEDYNKYKQVGDLKEMILKLRMEVEELKKKIK